VRELGITLPAAANRAKMTLSTRMPPARRLATLAAFVHCLGATAQNDVLEVLQILLYELFGNISAGLPHSMSFDFREREIFGVRLKTVPVGFGQNARMAEPSASPIATYQLRVVLCGVSQLVWRRLLVISETSLAGDSDRGRVCGRLLRLRHARKWQR